MSTQDPQPIIVPTGSADGKGYFSSSYYGNESANAMEATQQELQNHQTIQELGQKLGVDPNQLGAVETPETQQPSEVTTDTPDKEDFLKKFNSEEGAKFRQQFREYMGVDPLDAYNLINDTARLTQELEAWRSEVVRQRETETLRNELGQEFEQLMPEMVEYFKRLPPAQQKALDNLDGARMIAALIRQQKAQAMRGSLGNAPAFVQSNVRSLSNGVSAPTIRMSDLAKMSGNEVDKYMGDIIRAKQAGTFIYDL